MTTETTTLAVAQGHSTAQAKMIQYFQLQTEKAALDAHMKTLKEELRQFADENRELFEQGQYTFDCCGYLRLGQRTKVKLRKDFSLLTFMRKGFNDFVKKEFHLSALKAAFSENTATKNKARILGLTLVSDEEFEIVKTDVTQ
jgi:hypothetical protein